MKATAKLACLCLLAAIPAAYAAGMITSSRDAKLFQAYDKQRATMLERSCGSNSRLLQHPQTFAYSCVHTNKDGETIIRDVPESSFVAYRH